jgi:hypothetical protein
MNGLTFFFFALVWIALMGLMVRFDHWQRTRAIRKARYDARRYTMSDPRKPSTPTLNTKGW